MLQASPALNIVARESPPALQRPLLAEAMFGNRRLSKGEDCQE